MACTGIEFCKLAFTETKGRAYLAHRGARARLPGFDEDIRIHVNGCPNSCARFQVADIGLMAALQPRPDGTRSDAFLVHLGGAMGEGAAFGRKAKGVKIFAEDSADYVEALLVATCSDGGRVLRRVRERVGRRAARALRGAGTGRSSDERRARAQPFYCPFCGEQDLRPSDRGRVALRGLRPRGSSWPSSGLWEERT